MPKGERFVLIMLRCCCSLLLLIYFVYSAPTVTKQTNCSTTLDADNHVSIPTVLKSHLCHFSLGLASLYRNEKVFAEQINAREEPRTVCVGLSALVSYGKEKDLLNDMCSRVTFRKSEVRIIKFWNST